MLTTEPRAAARGRGCPRAGLHPGRRRLREDDDDHAPCCEPGRERGLSLRRDPGGHVHRQGGGRDARSAGGARRAGRALLDLPRGCARPAQVLRGRASAEDPRVEGAPAPLHREHAATPLPLPSGRRPRDRDRVGEEPAHPAVRVPELARRPRAADPEGPHAPRLPRVRAAQGRPGLDRLRGPDRAGDPALRRGRGRADPGSRALPGVHRRRVPGRQPAPADAPRPLARRPRRAVRGRRRLPVDLRLHGREPGAPARDAFQVPARGGDPPRGELPIDTGGSRIREPARAAARRGRKGPARNQVGRP